MPRAVGSGVGTFRPWNTVPHVPLPNPVWSEYWFLAFLPVHMWDRRRRQWTYELDYNPILGGQTLVKSIAIKRSRGFLLTNLTALITDTSAPPLPIWPQIGVNAPSNFLVQLTATKRKYNFFSQPAPLDNVAGGGAQSPGIPVPVYLEPGEVLNVQLQSLWARGLTNRIARLSFSGVIFL